MEIANDTISLLAGWTVMLGWLCARLLHMMLTEDPKTGARVGFFYFVFQVFQCSRSFELDP